MSTQAKWIALYLCLLPVAVFGQSTTTGAIGGVVRDATGGVLPGVTVEASSPALIEKVRTAVTDGSGSYKIVELRPGTYTVTFTLPGFATVKREGLELTTGFTANVNTEMKVGSLEETVTVTGASPVVDVQNVRQQTVLSRELWEALPTAKDMQSFVALTLGAVFSNGAFQDVGGGKGETPGNSYFTFHGTGTKSSRRTMDGMNFSDVDASGGSGVQQAVPNQLAVQESTVQTGGASAEAEVAGLWINLVPREGGNQFSGQFAMNGSHPSFQGNNLTPALIARGVPTPGSIKRLYDVGGGVGGPIRRDRLWFYASPHWWGTESYVPGAFYNKTHGTPVFTPDPSRQGYTNQPHHNDTIRLTWQAAAKHKISTLSEIQGTCSCFNGLDRGNHAPEASPNLNNPYKNTQTHQVTWNYPRTNRVLFEAGASFYQRGSQTRPSEGTTLTDIPYRDLNAGFTWGALWNLNGVASYSVPGTQTYTRNLNQRVSIAYVTGSHAVKVGWNLFENGSFGVGNSAFNNTPYGAVQLILRGGVNGVAPVGVQIAQQVSPSGRDPNGPGGGFALLLGGLFVQDQWRIQRLTLNLGLRFDTLHGWVNAQRTIANQFTGPTDFPAVPNVPLWKDLDPRVGGAFDLFGNGKTAVKASVGRYVQTEYTTTRNANAGGGVATAATRSWNDSFYPAGDARRGNLAPDCNLLNPLANAECGQMSSLSLGQPTVRTTFYDPDLLVGYAVRPYNWTADLTVQQELRPGWAINGGYYWLTNGNFMATQNRANTPADYDPFCVTAPVDAGLGSVSGSQICGLFDLNPAKFGQVNNLTTFASNFGKRTSIYHGFDLSVNARFGKGGTIQGGVGTGKQTDDSCFVINSPQQRFCHTTNPWSAQTQIKFSGNYPLPWWGLQVSAVFQNLPGPTYSASRTYTSAEIPRTVLNRNLSAGTTTVALVVPNTLFEPRFSQTDVRLAKNFRFGRYRLRGQVDLYNVFNASPVLAVNSTYGSSWRRPTAVLDPRLLKLGMLFDF